MKIRGLLLFFLMSLLFGCGPKKLISYKPDNKIRADYLNDSVRVRFTILPFCHQFIFTYFYWSEKCKEPYSIQVTVTSKVQNKDSNLIIYKSLKLSTLNREYELINTQDTARAIMMEPQANGTSMNKMILDLGKIISKEKTKTFKITLQYRFNYQTGNNIVEKEFELFEESHFKSIF